MKTVQLFGESFSAIKRIVPKGKLNPAELRLAPKIEPPIDTFVSTAPRKLNKQDIYHFRQYLLGKELETKITPKEIEELFVHKGEEFNLKAFEFLTKKLNVPTPLKPQLVYMEVPNAAMAYDFVTNIMMINPAVKFADKSQILSTLTHEYRHFMQNMAILRHPTKGAEAIELYAKISGKATARNVDNIARNISIEDLRKQGFDESIIREYQLLKDMIANNRTVEYEAYLAEVAKFGEAQALPQMQVFRAEVLKEMKPLKEGSREARRAEKYFEATANQNGYRSKNGEIDFGKFLFDIREIEAMTAQDMMAMQTNEAIKKKGCYLRIMKDAEKQFEEISNNNTELINSLNKQAEEINSRGISFKEMLSYIFD